MFYSIACVFLGCGLGGICRYALSAWLLKSASVHFPWATFTANALGCLLIGVFFGWLSHRSYPLLQLLLITGFCGGFTTFSTFSNETLLLLRAGSYCLAITYVMLSFIAGLFCVVAGFALVNKLSL